MPKPSDAPRKREGVRAFAPYILTVAITRGLSIVVLPFVAHRLTPAEYGRLEVVASVVEIAGLVFAFGLAETLARFSAPAGSEAERRRVAAEIAGTGLLLALISGVLLQLAAPLISTGLGVGVSETALRAALLAATVSGLIELPFAWLRLNDRRWAFASLAICSGLAQVILMMILLQAGYGVDGVLCGNAVCTLALAATLVVWQGRSTGFRLNGEAVARAARFGLPLVGGSLALFVLGAGDRWFLVQAVGPEQLAFYALATKFALAAPIALQPFGLWWYPRRIATYHGPDGPQRCAQAVGTGFAALVIAATIVSLAAPPFISAVMPASYAAAGQLVPLVVLCLALNEVCSLVNMGCYMRRHGGVVLAINAAGAAVAFAGYCLLIPAWGVPGAIAATLAGQGARAIAFPVVGQRLAPIAYPIGPAVLLASLSTFAVVFAPRTDLSLLGALWCAGSAVVLVATAVATGLVPKPALMTPVGRIRGVLRRQTAGRRSLRNS